MAKPKSKNNLLITILIAIGGLVYFSLLSEKSPRENIVIRQNQVEKLQKTEPANSLAVEGDKTGLVDSSSKNRELESRDPNMLGNLGKLPNRNLASNSGTQSIGGNVQTLKIDPKDIPAELPEDLRQQLLNPPTDIPPELAAQINAPRGEVPDDIKRALQQPPRTVSAEEVNLPPEELNLPPADINP